MPPARPTWKTSCRTPYRASVVASEVLNSLEASQVKASSFYQDTLGRLPDPAGETYWSSALHNGLPETTVLAGILASPEYFIRVEESGLGGGTDPNAVAFQMIHTNNLFIGPLANAEYLAPHLDVLPPTNTQPTNFTPDNNVSPSDATNSSADFSTNYSLPVDTSSSDGGIPPVDTTGTGNSSVTSFDNSSVSYDTSNDTSSFVPCDCGSDTGFE